jgi:hypothetical protein
LGKKEEEKKDGNGCHFSCNLLRTVLILRVFPTFVQQKPNIAFRAPPQHRIMETKKWGDAEEEEDWAELPNMEVYEDEKAGTKTTITYQFNAMGKMEKVTSKYQLKTKTKRVSKSVAKRSGWSKFGRTAGETSDFCTIVSKDEVNIQVSLLLEYFTIIIETYYPTEFGASPKGSGRLEV